VQKRLWEEMERPNGPLSSQLTLEDLSATCLHAFATLSTFRLHVLYVQLTLCIRGIT
jgi:hypothetical protein